jgi:hypothetical protein
VFFLDIDQSPLLVTLYSKSGKLSWIPSADPMSKKDDVKRDPHLFSVFLRPVPGRNMIRGYTGILASGLGNACKCKFGTTGFLSLGEMHKFDMSMALIRNAFCDP